MESQGFNPGSPGKLVQNAKRAVIHGFTPVSGFQSLFVGSVYAPDKKIIIGKGMGMATGYGQSSTHKQKKKAYY